MACGIYLNRETGHVTAHLKKEASATALLRYEIKVENSGLAARYSSTLLTVTHLQGSLGLAHCSGVESIKLGYKQGDTRF